VITGEEFLKVSGVLAVVVLGVRMSAEKTMISPELDRLEEFEDIKGVITYLYSMSCMLMLM
jgi:NhaP-type Na+/H+ or K+/H+ antiporter